MVGGMFGAVRPFQERARGSLGVAFGKVSGCLLVVVAGRVILFYHGIGDRAKCSIVFFQSSPSAVCDPGVLTKAVGGRSVSSVLRWGGVFVECIMSLGGVDHGR